MEQNCPRRAEKNPSDGEAPIHGRGHHGEDQCPRQGDQVPRQQDQELQAQDETQGQLHGACRHRREDGRRRNPQERYVDGSIRIYPFVLVFDHLQKLSVIPDDAGPPKADEQVPPPPEETKLEIPADEAEKSKETHDNGEL